MEDRKELGEEKNDIPRSEWNHLIDEWIFSERDRNILKRRLLDGLTFQQLADEFDMSVRQIKNIVYKKSEILFKKLSPKPVP